MEIQVTEEDEVGEVGRDRTGEGVEPEGESLELSQVPD